MRTRSTIRILLAILLVCLMIGSTVAFVIHWGS